MNKIKIYNDRGFCTHVFCVSEPAFVTDSYQLNIKAGLLRDKQGNYAYFYKDPLEGLTTEQAKVIEELQQADPRVIDKVIDFLDYSDEE